MWAGSCQKKATKRATKCFVGCAGGNESQIGSPVYPRVPARKLEAGCAAWSGPFDWSWSQSSHHATSFAVVETENSADLDRPSRHPGAESRLTRSTCRRRWRRSNSHRQTWEKGDGKEEEARNGQRRVVIQYTVPLALQIYFKFKIAPFHSLLRTHTMSSADVWVSSLSRRCNLASLTGSVLLPVLGVPLANRVFQQDAGMRMLPAPIGQTIDTHLLNTGDCLVSP